MTRANPLAMPLFDRIKPADALAASGIPAGVMERIIYDVIAPHVGNKNPISLDKVSQLTGFTDRGIKGIVASLITDHKVLIGASRKEPVGYFVIESEEDRAIAAEPYRGQILAMLARLRVLDGKHKVNEWLGQQVLTEK